MAILVWLSQATKLCRNSMVVDFGCLHWLFVHAWCLCCLLLIIVDSKWSQIKKKLESIFEKYNVSKASQESVEKLGKVLSQKTFTPDGKAWKMGITDKVLFNESKVTLLTSIYWSVLPIFKQYIMLFQRSKPMIHKLYYDQIDLFNQLLSYFVKPDVLAKWNWNWMTWVVY